MLQDSRLVTVRLKHEEIKTGSVRDATPAAMAALALYKAGLECLFGGFYSRQNSEPPNERLLANWVCKDALVRYQNAGQAVYVGPMACAENGGLLVYDFDDRFYSRGLWTPRDGTLIDTDSIPADLGFIEQVLLPSTPDSEPL